MDIYTCCDLRNSACVRAFNSTMCCLQTFLPTHRIANASSSRHTWHVSQPTVDTLRSDVCASRQARKKCFIQISITSNGMETPSKISSKTAFFLPSAAGSCILLSINCNSCSWSVWKNKNIWGHCFVQQKTKQASNFAPRFPGAHLGSQKQTQLKDSKYWWLIILHS